MLFPGDAPLWLASIFCHLSLCPTFKMADFCIIFFSLINQVGFPLSISTKRRPLSIYDPQTSFQSPIYIVDGFLEEYDN